MFKAKPILISGVLLVAESPGRKGDQARTPALTGLSGSSNSMSTTG